jgi:hypothetical protein
LAAQIRRIGESSLFRSFPPGQVNNVVSRQILLILLGNHTMILEQIDQQYEEAPDACCFKTCRYSAAAQPPD